MFIEHIISYGNSLGRLRTEYGSELDEITTSIEQLNLEEILKMPVYSSIRPHPMQLGKSWDEKIQALGWEESNRSIGSVGSRRILMRSLGFMKNRVSVSMQRHRESLNRWLYTLSPIAIRNGFIDIPIAVVLTEESETALFGRRPMIRSATLERTMEELVALSPLSHGSPFLIIGISMDNRGAQIIELDAENDAMNSQIVINRCIEFPPEFHQAGLGILNYFGAVLREKYPNHDAKVRIEQDGMNVRLIVESQNGDREIIERALQDYEMVVRGESPPEALFSSAAKVIELKNEIRIAQVRIESQAELLAYQGEQILSLRQIIGHAFTSNRDQPICIEVNPTINVNASAELLLQRNIAPISNTLQDLAAFSASDPAIEFRILDLVESVNLIEKKESPELVKEASGFKKLRKFIEDASETGSSLNTFLEKAGQTSAFAQKLGRYYNNIAEWCGAPVIPRILLGKE